MAAPGEEGGRAQRCPPRSLARSRDALRLRKGNAKAVEENLQAEEERTICAPIAPAGWARRADGWCPCVQEDRWQRCSPAPTATFSARLHCSLRAFGFMRLDGEGLQWHRVGTSGAQLSGVDVFVLEAPGFGARRPRCTSRSVAGGDRAICWGPLSPPAGTPWGSTALGSLQGKTGPSLSM